VRTKDLIELLAKDGQSPATELNRVVALAFLGGVALIALVFALAIGARADLSEAIWTTRVIFKMAVVIALAIVGFGLLMQLGRPTGRFTSWVWLVVAVTAALVAGVVFELAVVPSGQWITSLNGTNRMLCLVAVPALSIIPLAGAFAGLRHGAPRDAVWAGAGAGLAAGAVGATLYALNCNNDSPLFVATWYPIAIGMVVLLGAMIGRVALRW
jgi:hypothetical protein